MIIDNFHFPDGAISIKHLFEILLCCIKAETKHTNDVIHRWIELHTHSNWIRKGEGRKEGE